MSATFLDEAAAPTSLDDDISLLLFTVETAVEVMGAATPVSSFRFFAGGSTELSAALVSALDIGVTQKRRAYVSFANQ